MTGRFATWPDWRKRSGRARLRLGVTVTAVLTALGGLAVLPPPAFAAELAVRDPGDAGDAQPGDGLCLTGDGVCTLRAAVQEANALPGTDTITIPGAAPGSGDPFTVALGGTLEIASEVELVGGGAAGTVIDGGGSGVVLYLTGGPVRLRGITVRNGSDQFGGGVRVANGVSAEVSDVRIAGNRAFTAGGGLVVEREAAATVTRTAIESNNVTGAFGGGIINYGQLDVRESLVAGNDSNRSGGIYNASGAVLTLRNTTLSGNSAHSPEAGTGGLFNAGFAFLNNVTITGNKGQGNNLGSFLGGGLRTSADATTVVKNSIIARNEGSGGPDDCSGALTPDSGYTLIGSTTGCELPAVTDTWLLDIDPRLGGLAQNGGPTRSHLPEPGSPAVDAGFPFPPGGPAADSCEATDQRGVARLRCDLGAVEREVTVPTEVVVTTTADEVDAAPGDASCRSAGGACSLRAAVQEANALPGAQTIRVPAGTYGLSVATTDEDGLDPAAGGDLDLLGEVTVVSTSGTDRARVVVDGNDGSRVFDVGPGSSATLRRLTVRNGTDLGGGGIRVTAGALTLTDVVVADNASTSAGGGVLADGVLTVANSLVRGNRAPFFGGSGGGIDAHGTVAVTGSRIEDNEGSGSGGGLRATGTVTVRQSTVSGNSTSGDGGGVSGSGLTIEQSTVSGNTAGAQGGGVSSLDAHVVNSTVSGNTSHTSGGGLATSGSVSLLHVTIAGNAAAQGGSGLLRFGSTSSLTLQNTILADPPGPECAGLLPTSEGGNLAGDGSCGLSAAGDRQNVDARLGPLAANGGATATHLPASGSPAVDAAAAAGVAQDQRGVARPRGAAPDIGAVER